MNAGLKFGVGVVLELAEADYMYGIDPLATRLTEMPVDPGLFRGMEWVEVKGIDLNPAGEAEQPRYVTIRVSAIKAALRPPGWHPSRYSPPRRPVRRTTAVQQSPEKKPGPVGGLRQVGRSVTALRAAGE